MEAAVEKLETMFLKSEADLEYMEKRLKLDFINDAAETKCPTKNLATLMDSLKAIQTKHSLLCSEVKEIRAAQRESMSSIQNLVGRAMDLSRDLQQSACVQVAPLNKSEHDSAVLMGCAVHQRKAERLPQPTKEQ